MTVKNRTVGNRVDHQVVPRGAKRVVIFGGGHVGRGLFAAARRAKISVVLRPARDGLTNRRRDWNNAWLLVLAVRDGDLVDTANRLLAAGLVGANTAVVHVAGAQSPDRLAMLCGSCAGVGQMHPMIAFASRQRPPLLTHGHVRVAGDPVAVKRATWFVATLGMHARALPGLDPIAYHAAAGLVANGATALAAAGAELLARAGVDPALTPALLGPLLHSVAANVTALGLPAALTGPVRRGDAATVAHHLTTLNHLAPSLTALYRELIRAQIPLAHEIGDASREGLEQIEKAVL